MFCGSGAKLNDTASFCSNCGTAVGQFKRNIENQLEKKEDNLAILEVKPTFVWGYQIIKTIFRMFVILFCMLHVLMGTFSQYPMVFYTLLGITVAVSIIIMLLEKAQYKSIKYTFFKTKVEYVDGYLSKMEKDVKYKYVREVSMSQNVIERMFDIGKIRIHTNASSGYIHGGHEQSGRNGINIHCVKNIREVLARVKSIIDENSDEN